MSGNIANFNGSAFEDSISQYYSDCGYIIQQSKNTKSFINGLLIKNYRIVAHDNPSGFGRVEFFDSTLKTIIECKYQEVQGTAIDKIAQTIWRLSYQDAQSIIVYGGKQFNTAKISDFKSQAITFSKEHKHSPEHVRLMEISEFKAYHYSMLFGRDDI
jgi:hypothetical protein